MDEEPYYQFQEQSFEWDLKKIEQKNVSDFECLNLFDLGDIRPLINEIQPLIDEIEPFVNDIDLPSNEIFLNSQDEMSYDNLFMDIVDINSIIDLNESFSNKQEENMKEKDYKPSSSKKEIKRLDTQKMRNKEAVIKYRSNKMKKREELFKECEIFSKKNSELRKKCDDLLTEINLIKSLLVEALLAKNK